MTPPNEQPPTLSVALTPFELPEHLGKQEPSPSAWGMDAQAIDAQLDLIQAMLGEDFDARNAPTYQRWQQTLDQFERQQSIFDHTAAELLRGRRLAKGINAFAQPYKTLLKARLEAVSLEGELQRQLGVLDAATWQMLSECVEALKNNSDLPERYTLASLWLEQGTHRQKLEGVVIIAPVGALSQSPSTDGPLLLYWPGRTGALLAFASQAALLHRLEIQLEAADERTLRLQPEQGNLFHTGLFYQLLQGQSQAMQIENDPDYAEPSLRQEALEQLALTLREAVAIPAMAARELAMVRVREHNRMVILGLEQPGWIEALDETEREDLKSRIDDLRLATQAAQVILERDLPARDDFAATRVRQHLIDTFDLIEPCAIQIDLPEKVDWVKTLIDIAAGPGTPARLVPRPSSQRVKLSLEALLMQNIDEHMAQRLDYLQITVTPTDTPDAARLLAAIDKPRLQAAASSLDLAQHYENRLLAVYKKAEGETREATQQRQQTLRLPFEKMLDLYRFIAFKQGQLDKDGEELLSIASTAASAADWTQYGRDIELRPAYLELVDEADDSRGPTLLGVNFIHDRDSGKALLFLPDAPDHTVLRQYPDLQSAREGLAALCLNSTFATYLAGRAVSGAPSGHASRINRALASGFRDFVGIGAAWPVTTSLAQQLVDAQWGRLVIAHRDTSRSNNDLWMEAASLAHGRVFNYLKMVYSVLPVIGTVIAFADAAVSTHNAVSALLRGDVKQAVDETESVLLSLVGGLIDLLPTVPAGVGRLAALHRASRLSPLTTATAHLHRLSSASVLRANAPFKGYAVDVSLYGLQPGTQGRHRGVYRHADGEFIQRATAVYPVSWDASYATWRLMPTSTRSYRQPIALDSAGVWQTHGTLYGSLVDGGLHGGGGMIGRLLDQADPYFPDAMRQHLPRWWTDPVYRRHQQIKSKAEADWITFVEHVDNSNLKLQAYNDSPSRAATLTADTACKQDLKMASALFDTLGSYLQQLSRRNKVAVEDQQSRVAMVICDRLITRSQFARARVVERIDEIAVQWQSSEAANARYRAGELSFAQLHQQSQAIIKQVRVERIASLNGLESVESIVRQLENWYPHIRKPELRLRIREGYEQVTQLFTPERADYLKTSQLMELVFNDTHVGETSWSYLRQSFKPARENVDRLLKSQHGLLEVSPAKAHRQKLLQQCIEAYARFTTHLRGWSAGYPELFDADTLERLITAMERMQERARTQLSSPPPAQVPGTHRSTKRVFETEESQVLIGEPAPNRPDVMVIEGVDGHTELYRKTANNQYRKETASAPPRFESDADLAQLTTEATRRLEQLPRFRARVAQYSQQKMLPADLEDILLGEARELRAEPAGSAKPQARVARPD
ncbi:dermonecrotic toxin domain-containing protein [Pseudomonas sp. R5(2019)]|uniref:dermonecrotic toxin domain-containing protein n=1 Tax=Pseudomonas sp. R5(2019) TaxID=2697566 RepID=UPI001412D669|nr:DUF6543 domain-containing protein [Pseudomonas sp. R5(2019)]NBA94557.1 hypothetical protein [Pseudomonas sp. R5(2019)]